jgi:hypothetical protein
MDINTIGTLVIAVATSAYALIGWRAWRQQQADRQPIVELRHYWQSDGSLTLSVTIRNRLGESMVVEEARVLRPRLARLTGERTQDKLGQEVGFAPAKETRITLDWNVAPVGTLPATGLGGRMRFGGTAANETIVMNVQFPSGWRGGQLKIALRIASVSLNVHRRVTIKRRIPAPPASQSA